MEKHINLIGLLGEKQSGKNLTAKIIQLLIDHNLEPIEVEAILKQPEIKSVRSIKECGLDTTWEVKAFASKVKQILSIITGIPVEDMEKEDVKNTVLSDKWSRYGLRRKHCNRLLFFPCTLEYATEQQKLFKDSEVVKVPLTVRQALQYIGTDLFRDMFHEDTWIHALFADYKLWSERYGIMDISKDKIEDVKWSEEKVIEYPNWIITDVRFPNESDAISERGGLIFKITNPTIENNDAHSSETSINLCKFDTELIFEGVDNLRNYISNIQATLIAYNIIKNDS